MNLLQEIKALKSTPTELRKFGLTVGGVFAVLGCWGLYRHKGYGWPCLIVGGMLLLLGLVAPRILRTVYIAWTTVGLALGTVVTAVLLTVFFFLVVTPIGLIARVTGKDFLSLKLDPNASSYWVSREVRTRTAAEYQKQF